MSLDFRFAGPPALRMEAIQLTDAIRTVRAITARNQARETDGVESKPFKNRKEQLKRRLKARKKSETFEQVTDEVGRERLLLSLYLEFAAHSDAPWLPAFDETIASSVLGADSSGWHAGRRRQATQLFFTHFDQLPTSGLSLLCRLLVDAYAGMTSEGKGPVVKWRAHRETLFSLGGHQSVAGSAGQNITLQALLDYFAIPNNGRFAECLRQVFLLNAVRNCAFGQEIPELAEIEFLKTERASASLLMGAAALQIMVQRVAREGGRRWTGEWPDWIVRLGCDPRYGRATAEGARWWSWATDDELRLAQQGITGLTLHFFLEFLRSSLQGTDQEPQFELRSRFLMKLFDSGKIQSARLVLNESAYQRLNRKHRDLWTVSQLTSTTYNTSIICLKCIDDIFMIEGTHNFSLRVFCKKFPVDNFWERPSKVYQDRDLRISPSSCPICLPHDQGGNWVRGFFRQLRGRFHIEWNDVHV